MLSPRWPRKPPGRDDLQQEARPQAYQEGLRQRDVGPPPGSALAHCHPWEDFATAGLGRAATRVAEPSRPGRNQRRQPQPQLFGEHVFGHATTSWYGKESWEFAARHGRIELIDGPRLKHLLKEQLGLDVLISLPRRVAKTT